MNLNAIKPSVHRISGSFSIVNQGGDDVFLSHFLGGFIRFLLVVGDSNFSSEANGGGGKGDISHDVGMAGPRGEGVRGHREKRGEINKEKIPSHMPQLAKDLATSFVDRLSHFLPSLDLLVGVNTRGLKPTHTSPGDSGGLEKKKKKKKKE